MPSSTAASGASAEVSSGAGKKRRRDDSEDASGAAAAAAPPAAAAKKKSAAAKAAAAAAPSASSKRRDDGGGGSGKERRRRKLELVTGPSSLDAARLEDDDTELVLIRVPTAVRDWPTDREWKGGGRGLGDEEASVVGAAWTAGRLHGHVRCRRCAARLCAPRPRRDSAARFSHR